MKSLLDLGNTKIKLSYFNEIFVIKEFYYHRVDFVRLAKHLEKTQILYISSVNFSKLESFLAVLNDFKVLYEINLLYTKFNNKKSDYFALKDIFNLDIKFLDITSLINFKTDAKGIGIDRVLSLNFATYKSSYCAVITLGTAITVDVLSNNKHIGGFIFPGFYAQYNAILQNTDIEFDDFSLENNMEPALNTKDAVLRGVYSSVLLGLFGITKKLIVEYGLKDILISGGDRDIFTDYLKKKAINSKKYDNIVLRGLKYLLEDK